MANETELANIGHATDEVSDGITAALVNSVVVLPQIYSENLPSDSMVKLFRKAGSLAAAIVAESAGAAANAEYTETEITATAQKHAVVSRLTVEAQTFSRITNERLIMEQGMGLARDIDDEITSLFGSFATSVDAGVSMDTDSLMDAVFSVYNSNAGGNRQLIADLDYAQANDIRKALLNSGAAVFAQPQQTTLLAGAPSANGYIGQLPGLDCYQFTADTGGGNDIGLVFNPDMAFGSMISPGVQTRVRWVGDSDGGGTAGFYDELASWIFFDVVEWNDLAGCQVLSDS